MPAPATTPAPPELSTAGLRFKAGTALFALALVPYGLVLPAIFHHLPLQTLGTLVGVGVILQKVFLVSAVLVLGKGGFALLKAKLFHKLTPPAEVGPVRYRIGLAMFCIPLLQGLLERWASHVAPDLVANHLWVDVLMDTMLVASVFVLGGQFWDKLRALFIADARAVFPPGPGAAESAATPAAA